MGAAESLKLRFRTTPRIFLSGRAHRGYCRFAALCVLAAKKNISPKQSSLRELIVGPPGGPGSPVRFERGRKDKDDARSVGGKGQSSRRGEGTAEIRRSREPLRVIGSLERDSWMPKRVPMQTYKIRSVSVIAVRARRSRVPRAGRKRPLFPPRWLYERRELPKRIVRIGCGSRASRGPRVEPAAVAFLARSDFSHFS